MKRAASAPHISLSGGRRYDLQQAVGSGGMGAVFLALERLTGKSVALKQVTLPRQQMNLSPSADRADLNMSLAREFQALASILHPNSINVYDFGFGQQGQPYFTMELLEPA